MVRVRGSKKVRETVVAAAAVSNSEQVKGLGPGGSILHCNWSREKAK